MSGMAPIFTASGSLMSKLIPTVRRINTVQWTEPFRTFFFLARHTGLVAVMPALTGWMVQPSQPCTSRVNDVALGADLDDAARAAPTGAEAPAGNAAATATVQARTAAASRPVRRDVPPRRWCDCGEPMVASASSLSGSVQGPST